MYSSQVVKAVNAAILACAPLVLSAQSLPASIHQCLSSAAEYQGVPVELMMSVAKIESGFNPSAINRDNRNGTEDVGLMQINSSWLPKLQSFGITRKQLFDPCTNAHVGAWILADSIRRFGYTVEAVGAYNAGPKGASQVKLSYARKVMAYWEELRRIAAPNSSGYGETLSRTASR